MKPVSRKRKLKRRIILAVVAAILIALIIVIHKNVTNVLKSIAEASMRSITTVAVNDAVYYTLSDKMRYEDLIKIERGGDGEIQAISSNSFQINRIARDTAYMSQENLNSMSESGVEVPLGAFTGVSAGIRTQTPH